jgi:Hermes transposase DNA-binding domain/BED zinc finger
MSDSKKDMEQKKKEVIEKLKNGEFTAHAEPPLSSHGSFWKHLLRIKCCSNNEYEPFVQCNICREILSYSMPNGTSTISYHVKNCVDKSNKLKNNKTLDNYLSKPKEVTVTGDDKRSITIACAKFCSFDIRPFNIVKGPGFAYLCQSLLDLGYQYGTAKLGTPSASSLLPDPTNVSRTISRISEEYRERLKGILKNDLQNVKLIGVSTDYWKNSGTSENYLTVNIHYTKNEQNITYMLRTSLFDQSKTGDNTKKKIFSILSSYDIDPDKYHIIYVTDNGSNLVCGLRKCFIYHFIFFMICFSV